MSAYYWVPSSLGQFVPPNAVRGGTDIDGAPIFVGRAYHEGDSVPAKVMPTKNQAYIAYGGEELIKYEYEILCEKRLDWVASEGGQVPLGAVEGGRTADGEPLYIGRVYHEGAQTVGKVHPSHQCLYISFDGKEIPFSQYEILILRDF